MERMKCNCKFCGRSGEAKYDPAGGSMFDIDNWAKMLACNRCADFHERKRIICDAIDKVCKSICIARIIESKDIKSVEMKSEQALTILTEKLADLCCKHLNITRVWDDDFVKQFMDRPDMSWKITKTYFSMLKNLPEVRQQNMAI